MEDGASLTVASVTPSLVTLVGLALGLVGCVVRSPVLLVASLGADIMDGWAARRLHQSSSVGARLDFLSDVALAHVAVWSTWPGWMAALLSLALVAWQAAGGLWLSRRTSGRALVFIVAAWWMWSG